MIDDVAPDGSPVAVYLAMPDHDALDLVLDHLPGGGSVLDLGSGTGRLANPLADRGIAVTAIDVHPGMVAHLSPTVEAICGDMIDLDLRRTFDLVLLTSHLVNHATDALAFLATCRRHVTRDGGVVIERFHPDLLDDLDQQRGEVDGVGVVHQVHRRIGADFTASAHYTVDGHTWTQRYDAVLLDDDAIAALVGSAGLRITDRLDDDGRWLLARHA